MWTSELEEIKEMRVVNDGRIGKTIGDKIGERIVKFLVQNKGIVFELLKQSSDVADTDISQTLDYDHGFYLDIPSHGSTIDKIITDTAYSYVSKMMGIKCYVHLSYDYDICKHSPNNKVVSFKLSIK